MDVGSSIRAQVMDFADSANPYLSHMDVPLDAGNSWKKQAPGWDKAEHWEPILSLQDLFVLFFWPQLWPTTVAWNNLKRLPDSNSAIPSQDSFPELDSTSQHSTWLAYPQRMSNRRHLAGMAQSFGDMHLVITFFLTYEILQGKFTLLLRKSWKRCIQMLVPDHLSEHVGFRDRRAAAAPLNEAGSQCMYETCLYMFVSYG